MMTTQKMIEVMQAYDAGKKILGSKKGFVQVFHPCALPSWGLVRERKVIWVVNSLKNEYKNKRKHTSRNGRFLV